MKRSYLMAAALTLALTLWVGSGLLFSGAQEQTPDAPAADIDEAFTVASIVLTARDYTRTLTIRGRTEALRAVELKSEIDGRVVETPVEKGQRVAEGALVCRLSVNDRAAQLAQAEALAAQRRLERDAAVELQKQGHRSATQTAAAQAQYDAALAQVALAQVMLDNTEIRAPFAGLVDDRPAELGDFLQKGMTCATLIFEDPFLVVAEVSEQEVDRLSVGQQAQVKMISGEVLEGTVRYISATAQERTRTFRVEVEVPNPNRIMRDGMTADLIIPTETEPAHLLDPSNLVLDSAGRLGVNTLIDGKQVAFFPVEVVEDSDRGIWVVGLPSKVEVITSGQDYVRDGDLVEAERLAAEAGR